MLTIHHLGHSQSDRVVWLCEELQIPYDLKKYDRSPILSPPSYKALHPLGAAPVIEDVSPSSGQKILLAETEACISYILNVHGGGSDRLTVPSSAPNYADYLYWYHLTNGTFFPAMSRVMAMKWAGVPEDNPIFARYSEKIHQILKFYDGRLGETGKWLAGEEFTVADIMPVFGFTVFREFNPIDLSEYGNILDFLGRVTERPAYRRYLEKGDPDIKIEEYIRGPPPEKHPALRG